MLAPASTGTHHRFAAQFTNTIFAIAECAGAQRPTRRNLPSLTSVADQRLLLRGQRPRYPGDVHAGQAQHTIELCDAAMHPAGWSRARLPRRRGGRAAAATHKPDSLRLDAMFASLELELDHRRLPQRRLQQASGAAPEVLRTVKAAPSLGTVRSWCGAGRRHCYDVALPGLLITLCAPHCVCGDARPTLSLRARAGSKHAAPPSPGRRTHRRWWWAPAGVVPSSREAKAPLAPAHRQPP